MKRDLISEIINKRPGLKKPNLRSTLLKIKRDKFLTNTDQAACFYIIKHNLGINVSSIIEDRTMQALQNKHTRTATPPSTKPPSATKTRNFNAPRINWMTNSYYSKAEQLSNFYGYLFIFENALRIKINDVMSALDPNWWENKLKVDLPKIYRFYIEEKARQDEFPMVGSSGILQPIDYLTLGRLELIIKHYENEFVPSVFTKLDFFTGHMEIIRRVRNGIAHMAASITPKDINNAKHEIDIILQHLATK